MLKKEPQPYVTREVSSAFFVEKLTQMKSNGYNYVTHYMISSAPIMYTIVFELKNSCEKTDENTICPVCGSTLHD